MPDNRARNYNSAGRRPHTFTVHYSYSVPNLARTAHRGPGGQSPTTGRSPASRPCSAARRAASAMPTCRCRPARSAATARSAAARTGRGSSAIRRCRAPSEHSSVSSGPSASPRRTTRSTSGRREATSSTARASSTGTSPRSSRSRSAAAARLQLRAELYNAFNKSFWTTVNTNAEFDYTTRALTNPTVFGSLTNATTSARRIQLAARFTF